MITECIIPEIEISNADDPSFIYRAIVGTECVTIGRSAGNDIVLDDDKASRCHAEIRLSVEGYRLFDLQSQNSTFVNGVKITDRSLHNNDRIEIGNTTLIFQDREPSTLGDTTICDESDQASLLCQKTENLDAGLESLHVSHAEMTASDDENHLTLAESNKILSWLYSTSQKFNQITDFTELMNTVLSVIIDVTNADYGVIGFIDKDPETIIPKAIKYRHDKSGDMGHPTFSKALLDRVILQKEAVLISHGKEDKYRGQAANIFGNDIKSAMVVPLWRNEDVIGIMQISSFSLINIFHKSDLDLLDCVSNQLSVVIELERERKERESAQKERELAKAASAAKSEFLATMSHGIRTPLNAIIDLIELLLKTQLTTQQRDYLANISSSGSYLLGIINDILDFSKIEAGEMGLKTVTFSLPDILEKLLSIFYIETAEKGLEMSLMLDQNVPWKLVGDPMRLRQILTNLINNAIKSTDRGVIVISVSLVMQSSDCVRLRFGVTDTGIGISRGRISKLFESFSQADSSITRQYSGTGLGLAICKRLVELMNGDIQVKSTQGTGSAFIFEAEFGAETCDNAQQSIISTLRGLNVLVIDDSAVSRKVLEKMLGAFSVKVTTLRYGTHALQELHSSADNNPYNLVITDWDMPDMDGMEICKKIRADTKLRHIPLIMITAFDKDGTLCQQAEQIGIDAFLTKPVNPTTLADTIILVLGQCKITRNHRTIKMIQDNIAMEAILATKIPLGDDNEINNLTLTETELPELIPNIDINAGLVCVAGNKVLYYDLLKNFSTSHRDACEHIEVALKAADFNDACRLTHTLKLVSGSIGASGVFSLAEQLELAIKHVNAERYTNLLDQLKGETKTIFCALDDWFAIAKT